MSYKSEVQTDSTGNWYGNALRFKTRLEAEESITDLAMRWPTRVVASEDDPMMESECCREDATSTYAPCGPYAELQDENEQLRAALDKAERENEMLRDLNVSLTNAAEMALGTEEQ